MKPQIANLVSIIVAAYNAEAYIGQTLSSLLAQKNVKIEIIVINDGSTDKTAQIAESYGAPVQVYSQDNKGLPSARNAGLAHASGEFLFFFDADDLLIEDTLSAQLFFLKAHYNAGCVFVDYANFSGMPGGNEPSHFSECVEFMHYFSLLDNPNELLLPAEQARELLLKENFAIAGSGLYRREVIEEIGGFDPELKACEDFHLYYRVALKWHIGVMRKLGYWRRIHQNNLSSNSKRMIMYSILCRRKLLLLENSPTHRRLLQSKLAYYHAEFARLLAAEFPVEAIKNICKSIYFMPRLDFGIFKTNAGNVLRILHLRSV
jgi:glycosyltransferase involved in cell wall biosynthesis